MRRSHKIGHRLAEQEFGDDARNLIALFTEYVNTYMHDAVVIDGEVPDTFEDWLQSAYEMCNDEPGTAPEDIQPLVQAMDTLRIEY